MWWFNTEQFYVDYPHYTHSTAFKSFYLLQAANWAHLFVVLSLQLEKPRKDFFELTIHHFTTLALIFLSYRFHFTWIGVPVFWTHDISDVGLAAVKLLNYMDPPDPVVPVCFTVFTGCWIYTRHVLGLRILWSVATEFQTVGLWILDWDKQWYKCWISQYVTLGLLSIIQVLDIYWLFLILRIAFRILTGGEQKDDREDDDEDESAKKANGTKKYNLQSLLLSVWLLTSGQRTIIMVFGSR
jgi:very-long-chain ceramide synthase